MHKLSSETVDVFATNRPNEHVSTAHFIWAEGAPMETYTIDIGSFISLELDKHQAVRPNSVTVYDEAEGVAHDTLEMYVGADVANTLKLAPIAGNLAITTCLNSENRLHIASLQVTSPSTPQALKHLCESMLAERTRLVS